jgi:hypothetical protein
MVSTMEFAEFAEFAKSIDKPGIINAKLAEAMGFAI